MIEIQTGVVRDIPDNRNLRFEDVAGAAEAPSWEEGFDLEAVYGPLTIKHQGPSYSCVGQAFSSYAEMLNRIEESKTVSLSARSIYSKIYLPQGGSRIADAAKVVKAQGVSTEELCPSYPNNETDFYVLPTVEAEAVAATYKAKSYATVAPLVEEVRRAIFQSHGVVAAFVGSYRSWHEDPRKGVIHPPTGLDKVFAHCMYLVGYKMIDGVKMVIAKDSYGPTSGDNGRKYIPWEEYFNADYQGGNCMFNLWTLVDLPNTYKSPFMFNLVKGPKEDIFAVKSGIKFHITNMTTFNEGLKIGLWADLLQVNTLTQAELDAIPTGKAILFIDSD